MNLSDILDNSRMVQITCGAESVRVRSHKFNKGEYYATVRHLHSDKEMRYGLSSLQAVETFLEKFMRDNHV